MKTIHVRIKGTAPMLMHRYEIEKKETKKAKKDKVYDPVEDAKKALYADERGIYVPSEWIEGTIREAAKQFKNGKSTMKAAVQAGIFIKQDKIYLDKDTYDDIDRRPVVVQRQRVVRSRPKFNDWELTFDLQIDDDRVHPDTLKDILKEAGSVKGIGDYRPRFGRFAVEEFTVK